MADKWFAYDDDTGMEYWHDGDTTRSQCHDAVGLVTRHTQTEADFLAMCDGFGGAHQLED